MLFCREAREELSAALERAPGIEGREVVVLNGAHAAYKQPQQLNKIAFLFAQGHRPDVALNLDGFNEVAEALYNGSKRMDPLYPSAPVWAGLLCAKWGAYDKVNLKEELTRIANRLASQVETAKRWGLFRSAVAGTILANRLNELQNRRVELEEALRESELSTSKRKRERDDREIRGRQIDLALEAWVECSISLDALCRARGVAYVHALQPTLWDEGAKPMSPKEARREGPEEWRRGVQLGYPRLRAAIPRLEAADITVLDLSMSFADVEETLYFDPCHFEPAGSKLLVDDVARAITDAL